ncbi:MAG: 6-phosphogluconolactonase [Desulforhopalus sp.]
MILRGTTEQMVAKGTELLYQACKHFIRKKDRVVLAVPGGRSVVEIFNRLGLLDLEWPKVHIFLLDERLVPDSHHESNYRLVMESFGESVPGGVVHPFRYEVERAGESVTAYGNALDRCGGCFDIVLASSGEDGHIGSLFPGHPSVKAKSNRFILVHDSPKPPSGRMSASVGLLRRSDTGILLFFGGGKHNALQNFCNSDQTHIQCPAKIIAAMPTYYVLTDLEVDQP